MLETNPKADFFFHKAKAWQEALEFMRKLPLECQLREEVKWGSPCYTFEGKNVVLIHAFKDYCAYLFFKGALLSDPEGILIRQTATVQAPRQLRFTDVKQVKAQKQTIKAYIYEAIEVEKAGLKVEMKKTAAFEVPEEFKQRLSKDAKLKKAFEALTPGRQRAYLLHFSSAKQSKTREARIDKSIPAIMSGKGLDD